MHNRSFFIVPTCGTGMDMSHACHALPIELPLGQCMGGILESSATARYRRRHPAWRLTPSFPQVRATVTLAAVSAAAGSTAFMPAKVAAFIHVSTFGIWLGEHTRACERASKLWICRVPTV